MGNAADILQIENHGAVRVLTLHRPDVRNALNTPLLRALRAAIADAGAASVRCLVLTGAGKGFCAGADVAEWAEAEASGKAEESPWMDEMHGLIRDVAAYPKPSIAVLNGAAVGAGLDLALACDFRFTVDSAKFICAYTKMAYPPDAGGSWFLPRIVGVEAAKRFVFTGETWLASEAKARGLVSEIHPTDDLLPKALAFAGTLAQGPTLAQIEAKRLIDSGQSRSLDAQLYLERAAGQHCAESKDFQEAMAASIERRTPAFRGE
ncbi:MAG: enoyl-CoA hydratase-related protein [Rhodospirillaceae bacterium]|nr:enoyl-CoA hydratase-related protein [Rhodospirillaceae bacterium]